MKHPFAEEVFERKYFYVIGVAMVAFENGEISKDQKDYLMKLAKDIGLTKGDMNKILTFARKYQTIKDKVISVLDTPYKKYCFLMELYNMSYRTNMRDKEFIKGISQFAQLLDIAESEYRAMEQVCVSIEHNDKRHLIESMNKLEKEQAFLEEQILKYFAPEEVFSLEQEVASKVQEERVLKKGEEIIISGPYKIMGPIRVLEGARLVFDEAEVEVYATIRVEGGTLEIIGSKLKVKENMQGSMFMVMDTRVHIQDSSFDGNETTGIWCHINGELFIEKSTFVRTADRPCIMLWDCPASLKSCQFIECRAGRTSGGAVYTNSNLEVLECSFEACSAYQGAAIYRFAAIIPWVEDKSYKVIEKEHTRGGRMRAVFGRKIDFVPIPKSIQRIAYPVILNNNKFVHCHAHKLGVVCAYKQQVIINNQNTFDYCQGQSIYYYE